MRARTASRTVALTVTTLALLTPATAAHATNDTRTVTWVMPGSTGQIAWPQYLAGTTTQRGWCQVDVYRYQSTAHRTIVDALIAGGVLRSPADDAKVYLSHTFVAPGVGDCPAHPAPTPEPTWTPAPDPTPSTSPTAAPSPTSSPTPSSTPTPTPSASSPSPGTPSPSPTSSEPTAPPAKPSPTPAPSPTPTSDPTPTTSPTAPAVVTNPTAPAATSPAAAPAPDQPATSAPTELAATGVSAVGFIAVVALILAGAFAVGLGRRGQR